MLGYYAGPEISFIDQFALCDPLLARIPIRDKHGWRIGHFFREMPAGYFEAKMSDSFDAMDPSLRTYYEKLRFIISGSLWSVERVSEIIKFNLGIYDPLMEIYAKKHGLL